MIDFLKIGILDPGLFKKVWNNQELIFHSDEEKRVNDEVQKFRKKRFRELTFTLYPKTLQYPDGRLEITGSLHKYRNNGVHNADDFSWLDSVKVIRELEGTFTLDLKKCFVINAEFGLNVVPEESVEDILVSLKYQGRNEYRPDPGLQYVKQAGSFYDGKLNLYKFQKAYAKGLQPFGGRYYGHPNNFRFEGSTKQRKYLKRLGIHTLEDLTTMDAYVRLSDELSNDWDNVLLIDKSLPETKKTAKYQSLDFWETCWNGHRNKFATQRKKYFNLLEEYPDNIHHKLKRLFKNKLDKFESEFKKSGAYSTRFEAPEKNKSGAYSNYVYVESAPFSRSYRNIEAKGLKLWPTLEMADREKLELIMN